jgi:hypothetical protein
MFATKGKRKIDVLCDEELKNARSKIFNNFDMIESFTKVNNSLENCQIIQLLNIESIKTNGGNVGDYLFSVYKSKCEIMHFRTFHLAIFYEKEDFNYYHKPRAYSLELKLPQKWCNIAYKLITLQHDEILGMIIFDLLKKAFEIDVGFKIWSYL